MYFIITDIGEWKIRNCMCCLLICQLLVLRLFLLPQDRSIYQSLLRCLMLKFSVCIFFTGIYLWTLKLHKFKTCMPMYAWGRDNEVENFTISSLCRFPIQKADFCWGIPSLIHFRSRHSEIIWLNHTECETVTLIAADSYVISLVRLFSLSNDM